MPEVTHASLREQLTAERERVQGQLSQLGHDHARESFDENFADSGQVAAEQGEARALANSLRDNLAEIERALARLDAGTYGICENCGQPIAEARLEAMPTARRCITCAA